MASTARPSPADRSGGFALPALSRLPTGAKLFLILSVGLLPLATALCGVLHGGERPRPLFWMFSGAGSAVVAGFAPSAT